MDGADDDEHLVFDDNDSFTRKYIARALGVEKSSHHSRTWSSSRTNSSHASSASIPILHLIDEEEDEEEEDTKEYKSYDKIRFDDDLDANDE